jgi:hypothetical protein
LRADDAIFAVATFVKGNRVAIAPRSLGAFVAPIANASVDLMGLA